MANDRELQLVPRGLSQHRAAHYVGVPLAEFLKMVGEGKMPPPTSIGMQLLWDRQAIDRYFDVAGASAPDMAAWGNLITLALKQDVKVGEQSPPGTNNAKYQFWYQMPPGPERDKRQAKEEAKDRAAVRHQVMGKWERVALWELYRHENQWVDASAMKGVTFRTHERLKARGYVAVRANQHGSADYWRVTARGVAAVKNIPEEAPPGDSAVALRRRGKIGI